MKIIRWDPFKDMMMVDEFFESMANNGKKEAPSTWSPAVDVYETEKEVVLAAEIPGVRQEDINLTVYDNILTLKGERRFERDVKQESYHRVERNYGYFCRRFSMPCEVESGSIKASFKDGVLEVIIPKGLKTKKVQVKVKG